MQILSKIKAQPEFAFTLWSFGGQFCVSIAAFVLTYVLANFVSKEVVGEYRFIIALYASISVLTLSGVSTALMRATAAGHLGSLTVAYRYRIQFGLIGTVLFACIAGYYWWTSDTVLAIAMLIAGVAMPCIEAGSVYASYLKGASRFAEATIGLVIQRGLVVVGVVAGIFITPQLLVIVSAYLILQLVVNSALYIYARRNIDEHATSDPELRQYSAHLTYMSIFGAVTTHLDKYILFVFFGPATLASYWVASVIPQEVGRAVSIIVSTVFPRMVRSDEQMIMRTLRFLFVVTAGILLIIAVVYALIAPWLFAHFLPAYTESVWMSVILLVAYGFVPHLFVWQAYTAHKKVRHLYWLSTAEPIILLVGYLVFIPIFGVWGLVYALCAKMLLLNAAALILVCRTKL